ncbi:MAG: hypothetical protein ACK2VD_22720 [Anaerolineae bacterium]|jgi:hypothetical protein
MTERKIQTEAFWRDEFAVTDEDVPFIEELFLDEHRPLSLSELSSSLITHYYGREENLIRRQLMRGRIYRPNASFAVGEQLVFPQLDFALGTVVSERKGNNPEYEDFQVIAVEFEDGDLQESSPTKEVREFAADLKAPHKLSLPDEVEAANLLTVSPADLFESYGDVVQDRLAAYLASNPDFIEFRGYWLPKGMAPDVHIGLLNIAEAMLVMEEKPLAPEQLLRELDLPKEIPTEVKVFALDAKIAQDERFVDVGDEERILWALQRGLPRNAVTPPEHLRYEPVSYDRTVLDVTHLQIEREIDDEASRLVAPPTAARAQQLTLILTYPHWRYGTLSLTQRTRGFFPAGLPGQRTQITFLDRVGGSEFKGWVVHEHHYVYGLEAWYEANEVPAGAYIKLERVDDPHTVAVDLVPRRMQREWTRMVTMDAEGGLAFSMQKRPIACEYDELCLIDEPDREIGDALRAQERALNRPLRELVRLVYLELAKLNPSVTVHGKTLYTAVNVLRRCPPGLVFATLFGVRQFITTGDGYWVLQGGA